MHFLRTQSKQKKNFFSDDSNKNQSPEYYVVQNASSYTYRSNIKLHMSKRIYTTLARE